MFGWFKKKAPDLSPEMKALAERLFGPQALSIAIAKSVSDYADGVKAGSIEYPAHRRTPPNVEMVWRDLRLEALQRMFGFGQADLMMLADIRRQPELLTSFMDERPHLEYPQPRGQPVADTLQAVWQVYLYLDAVGTEVADQSTDRAALKAKGRDILSNFTAEASELRNLWAAYDQVLRVTTDPLPDMPRTMIDLLWADVTVKTKSIALSTVFGPYPESGMQHLLSIVAKQGTPQEVVTAKASLNRVRAAREPDDIQQPESR